MDQALTESSGNPGPHFTYRLPDISVLHQGDILEKTGDLLEVICQVHPHYARDERVTHFQVLTQSCDLARRNGRPCKARYITIAAVRTLDCVIQREIEEYSKRIVIDDIPICSDQHLLHFRNLVSRLLNNNDEHYFYLKAESQFGLFNDSCTVLPLSIAIRGYEHYEKCLAAKRLQLEESFQAKLGWKVGNMYSRVGTIDYAPGAQITEKQFDELLEEITETHVRWVPDASFETFKKVAKREIENGRHDIDAIERAVDAQLGADAERRLGQVVSVISRALGGLAAVQEQSVMNALNQQPLIQKAIKKAR